MNDDKCPNCEQPINSTSSRLIEDSCGHKKCRLCLVQEEEGCLTCQRLQKVSGKNKKKKTFNLLEIKF